MPFFSLFSRRVYDGCNRVYVNKYRKSIHIIVKGKVLDELNSLKDELESQGLELDYCTLILMGIDAYRKNSCL